MNAFWRWAERVLERHIPHERLAGVLGDLAEDLAAQRARLGDLRAALWLVRETRSLGRAYSRERRRTTLSRIAWRDEVTQAWRGMRVRPAVPVVCAGLLALAIALPTAMFSVIDSVLLRPLPFPGSERLLKQTPSRPEPDAMAAWKETGLFEAVEAASESMVTFEIAPDTPIGSAAVTSGMFQMLGVVPVMGRGFAVTGAPDATSDEILLSETLWRSMFGADPSLLGAQIRVQGESLQVVGILPSTFRFPSPHTLAWRPLDLVSWPRPVTIYGRTAPNVSRAEVTARIEAITRHLAYVPVRYRGTPPLTELDIAVTPHTRQALTLLMIGVALVFVALCANVVILLLSRLSHRRLEFATCAALGSSNARLVRRLVLEHLFIIATGGAASLLIARAISTALPAHLIGQTLNVVDIDTRAMTLAAVVASIAVLVAGIVPAWLGTRLDPASVLRRSEGGGGRFRSRLTTHGLLITQVALAAALLIGSTVLVRSFVNMAVADRGVDVEGVLRIRISDADVAFTTAAAMTSGTARIGEAVRGWPEVRAAALSREIPPLSYGAGGEARVEDLDGYRVSPEFFSLYGITLASGTAFVTSLETDEVIVSERLARQMWPGENAVGQVFRLAGDRPRRVIGISREITLPALEATVDRPEFYLPMGDRSRTLYASIRCVQSCPPAETIKERIRRIHPALGATVVQTGEMPFLRQLELPHAIAQVSGAFAALALVTAACGLYSVLTFVARRRRREFGIRQLLGASPRDIGWLVIRQGLAIIVLGGAIGALAGWGAARSLSAFLYGVVLLDPLTWAVPIALLAAASLGAMWIPCRRATYVNPLMLIREE